MQGLPTTGRHADAIAAYRAKGSSFDTKVTLKSVAGRGNGGIQLEVGESAVGQWLGRSVTAAKYGITDFVDGMANMIRTRNTAPDAGENRTTMGHFIDSLRGYYGESQAKTLILEHGLDLALESGSPLTAKAINEVLQHGDAQFRHFERSFDTLKNSGVIPESVMKRWEGSGNFSTTVLGIIGKTPFLQEAMMDNMPLSPTELRAVEHAMDRLADFEIDKWPANVMEHYAQSLVSGPVEMADVGIAASVTLSLLEKVPADKQLAKTDLAPLKALVSGDTTRLEDALAAFDQMRGILDDQIGRLKDPKDAFLRETLTGMKDQVTQAARNRAVEAKITELKTLNPDFRNPGDGSSLKVRVEGKVGLGVFNVNAAEGGFSIEYNQNTTVRDDHKVEKQRKVAGGLLGRLGIKGFNLSGEAAVGYQKARVFPSVDAFFLDVALKTVDQKAKPESTLTRRRFNERLQLMGVVDPQERVDVQGRRPPDVILTRAVEGRAKLSGEILNAVLKGSVAKTTTTFSKSLPLLEALETEPQLAESAKQAHYAVQMHGRRFQGKEADAMLNALQKRIEVAKSKTPVDRADLDAARIALMYAVKNLEQEFGHYADTARRVKPSRVPLHRRLFTSAKKSPEALEKAAMERARGAKSTADFVTSTTHTFARLSEMVMATVPQGETLAKLDPGAAARLEFFGRELMNPDLPIDPAKLLAAKFSTTGTAEEVGGSFTLKFGAVEAEVTVKTKIVKGDINPDNDGVYHSIGFEVRGDATASQVMEALIQSEDFGQFMQAMTHNEHFADFKPDFKAEAFKLTPGDMQGLDVGFKAGLAVNLQFKADTNGPKLEYARVQGSGGVSGQLPTILVPVGGGVQVGVNVSAAKTTKSTLYEFMGTNTLSYVKKAFNSKKADGPNAFGTYMKENEGTFKSMFKKLGTPGSSIRKEAEAMLKDAKATDYSADFFKTMEAYKSDPKKNEQKAKQAFVTFMERQHEGIFKPKQSERMSLVKKKRFPALPTFGKKNAGRTAPLSKQKDVSGAGKTAVPKANATVRTTPSGLDNVTGNSCFFNAGLNMLAMDPEMIALFQLDAERVALLHGVRPDLPREQIAELGERMHRILTNIEAGRLVDPADLTRSLELMETMGMFQDVGEGAGNLRTRQHDAAEILFQQLLPLFDPFGEQGMQVTVTRRPVGDRALVSATNEGDYAPLTNGDHTVQNSVAHQVRLSLPAEGELDLQTMLESRFATQRMDDFTYVDNGPVYRSSAEETTDVGSPRVLNIQLQRATYGEGGGQVKDGRRVQVPNEVTVNGIRYRLAGAMQHHGDNPNAGHYTALTRRDGVWHEHNDRNVTRLGRELGATQREGLARASAFTYVRVDD
ncbi:ubiquitin carboxyl-terminal hydrolase [Acanthopleuribacter pedis]|uniref:USP domain-containing protein n=1 Tax=Acanthopleuribacter pedis TaxID=442870 RepID=A0A8J7U5Q7_9BACT|nr:ubiquitin carboxyl-terminal hydrolase family protein [Acanthopleuribacter pedis]MBO1320713.1 hypothetical protein [Acanthopleuribacter pedis]